MEWASRCVGSSGGDVKSNDPGNRQQQRGPADYNRTQQVIANYSHLPSYKGNRGIAGRILTGWTVSGVTTAQRGLPLTLTDYKGGAVYGFAGTSRAQLCPGITYTNIPTARSVQSRLTNYFSASALCDIPLIGQANGAGGATGYGNSCRGIVFGPDQFDWDIAAGKRTLVGGLREDATIDFRAEFFNAFNHPQFANPGVGRTLRRSA